jgi:hypothetical protein
MRNGIKDPKAFLAACSAICVMLLMVLVVQASVADTSADAPPRRDPGMSPTTLSVAGVDTPPCTGLVTIALSAPITGVVHGVYSFTGTVNPDATPEITYTWTATAQDPIRHTIEQTTDTITRSWDVAGEKTVTLTAINGCSEALRATATITIEKPMWTAYLPFAVRNTFKDPFEPNDSTGDAYGPLESARSYSAYFPDESDPDDFYFISVPPGTLVAAYLDVPDSLDLDLWIYDEALKVVSASHKTGKGVSEALQFTSESPGKHFLRVYPFSGRSMSDWYTLVATY